MRRLKSALRDSGVVWERKQLTQLVKDMACFVQIFELDCFKGRYMHLNESTVAAVLEENLGLEEDESSEESDSDDWEGDGEDTSDGDDDWFHGGSTDIPEVKGGTSSRLGPGKTDSGGGRTGDKKKSNSKAVEKNKSSAGAAEGNKYNSKAGDKKKPSSRSGEQKKSNSEAVEKKEPSTRSAENGNKESN